MTPLAAARSRRAALRGADARGCRGAAAPARRRPAHAAGLCRRGVRIYENPGGAAAARIVHRAVAGGRSCRGAARAAAPRRRRARYADEAAATTAVIVEPDAEGTHAAAPRRRRLAGGRWARITDRRRPRPAGDRRQASTAPAWWSSPTPSTRAGGPGWTASRPRSTPPTCSSAPSPSPGRRAHHRAALLAGVLCLGDRAVRDRRAGVRRAAGRETRRTATISGPGFVVAVRAVPGVACLS